MDIQNIVNSHDDQLKTACRLLPLAGLSLSPALVSIAICEKRVHHNELLQV